MRYLPGFCDYLFSIFFWPFWRRCACRHVVQAERSSEFWRCARAFDQLLSGRVLYRQVSGRVPDQLLSGRVLYRQVSARAAGSGTFRRNR